jgi:Cu/Ag efflux protein CusF
MRLYKVVVLVNIALGTGFLFGYHWWGQEVIRLNRELATAKQTAKARQPGVQSWSVRGIVRGVSPELKLIFVTHEEIPGLMGAMTMGFRADSSTLLRGLSPGDLIQFTLKESEDQLVIVALRKEESR